LSPKQNVPHETFWTVAPKKMTTQEWKKSIIQIIYMLKLSQTQQSKLPLK